MLSNRSFLLILFVFIVVGSAAPAVRAEACTPVPTNLVVNCGFETGNLAGWTTGGTSNNTSVVAAAALAGGFGLRTGEVGSFFMLSQDIPTVVGQRYDIGYWLRNLAGSQSPSQFAVTFGNVIGPPFVNEPSNAYVLFTFSAVAVSTSTRLQFSFRHDSSFWYMDEVLVIPVASVPEPATMLLLCTGLLGVAVKVHRHKR